MNELPADKIHVQDLLLRCILGVNPEERVKKQDVVLNLTLWADLSLPARTDRIEDTLDYKNLKKRVVDLVEGSSFLLVEALAGAVADLCLEVPLVRAVRVRVDKPGALRFAKSVAVEIFREKKQG